MAEIQRLCPGTMLVSMGDRVADIYKLFLEATKDPCGPKLLARAEKSRARKVEQEHLWQFMSSKEIAGTLKARIPRSTERRARSEIGNPNSEIQNPKKEAIIDVRFSEVSLTPPKDKNSPPIKVWAVYAFESEREEGKTPIEWMLLTTAEVNSLEEAKQRVEWYSGRKRDGMPGTECIWRGLQRLDTAVEMYALFKHESLPRYTPSYPLIPVPDTHGVKCG